MIPFAASLLLKVQGAALVLPKNSPVTVSSEIRDWPGFGQLPPGPRETPKAFPSGGDWSTVKGTVAADATVWRVKVVILDRVDRSHDRGASIFWPGHHGLAPYVVERVRRALPLMRARVADLTGGSVALSFDVSEETEVQTVETTLAERVVRYLSPRINGGRYEAEDGVFRGPYSSVFIVHPLGGEPVSDFEVQGATVSLVGLPDLKGGESDGVLANDLALRWLGQAARRARSAGATVVPSGEPPASSAWPIVAKGDDDSTEERLWMLGTKMGFPDELTVGGAWNERGPETTVRLTRDLARGNVLTVDEVGDFRQGGFALPKAGGRAVDGDLPTLTFWAKSDAKDPVVLQIVGASRTRSIWLGREVPFAYDGAWQEVRADLRSLGPVAQILVAPDTEAAHRARQTIGPIEVSFADFRLDRDPASTPPVTESPSATAISPEARAVWAYYAEPGYARRGLLKDPVEAVRANAAWAAAAKPDPKDEPALTEDALFTFEPTVFTPALRALAAIGTPTSMETVRRALRAAAADRARGVAAEILGATGNPTLVPLFVGLNQARTRAARISAIRALAHIPGNEATLMRLSYLGQDDPEVKLAATQTADPDEDAQGRKLLWSALNEPSDAVRLSSLVLLSRSKVPNFRQAGLDGVHDDSVGVRARLLAAWATSPSDATLPAVRIALKDASPRVRAAAIDALSANPTIIVLADLPLEDPDPRVDAHIAKLARERKLAIPESVRQRWRTSPDPTLRLAADTAS